MWQKRPLPQLSVQPKHTIKKKDFLWRCCYLKWLDSFLWTSRSKGILYKTLSSRYFESCKTSWCFCHISKQKDLFCWSRTHSSNWRENCFLEWEKTGKYAKMIADHDLPSWKMKCIVAEVGCWGYIPPSFRQALKLFGFTSKELKTLVDECSLLSRRSSYCIWLNRFHQTFIPF